MPKPKVVTMRPNATTVVKFERSAERDAAFRAISRQLTEARATLHCISATLKACDAANTDDDVGHADTALETVCQRLSRLHDALDSFDTQHLSKTRVVQS